MPNLKVGVLAIMLIAPVAAHAEGPGKAFDNFGHSVATGAKTAGHAIKNGARNVGHSIESGWHSFKRSFADR
jgi:hypothetical protein